VLLSYFSGFLNALGRYIDFFGGHDLDFLFFFCFHFLVIVEPVSNAAKLVNLSIVFCLDFF
jgi:hypothetical protein